MADWKLIFAVLSCYTAIVSAGPLEHDVYIQERSTSNYMYKDSLPEMTENTVCFWGNFGSDDDDFYDDYLLSISTSANYDAFAVGLKDYLFVTIDDVSVNFTETVAEISHLFKEWHYYCFVWKSDVDITWYVDVTTPRWLEPMSTVAIHNDTIASGGYLVLMHDQDSHGGSLDVNQAMTGKITDFDIWDYAMDIDQIEDLRCRDSGNVVSWDTILEAGFGVFVGESLPCKELIPYGGTCELAVYTQPDSTGTKLGKNSLPEMSENTICYWIAVDPDDDDNRENDYMVSISTSDDPDEYLLGWTDPQSLTITIRSHTVLLNDNDTAENDLLFLGWHKHCFTFKDGGSFTWYADKTLPGTLEVIKTFPFSPGAIRSGGKMRLMMDQNSYGGGIQLSTVTKCKLTWFHMWDYAMSEEEVKSLNCRDVGNLVRWGALSEWGDKERHTESLGDLPYQAPELEDLSAKVVHKAKYQAMSFCNITGASLGGAHNLYSITVTHPARCVLVCIKDDMCWSVNYQHSTKSCTINDDIDQGNEADFSTELGNDFTHFTCRECVD